MSKPQRERPVFPYRQNPKNTISNERGVSPVIAVILMVAITVVLAAVLYVMVTGIMKDPGDIDFASLDFKEDDTVPDKYYGTFHGSNKLDNIEIKVVDVSSDTAGILNPSTENYKEISSGLNITYQDVNENTKIDATDILILYGGKTGDTISVVNKNSGNMIAEYTLK